MHIEKDRQFAVNQMVREISSILSDCGPSIYMYGSSVLNDFRLGWSDIDILVLTDRQISEEQAKTLVGLRQAMLTREPGNPYYRSFEGWMLSLHGFLTGETDRVVYWGTSGERITDTCLFDSFGMTELIESSALLYGSDIRKQLRVPEFSELYADVKRHYEAIRKYAKETGRSFYSFGWMLDIARCIYTLRTGKIIAKTSAAEWALQLSLCPDPEALGHALQVRRNPLEYKDDKETFDYAETLAEPIQRFADVLEEELNRGGALQYIDGIPYRLKSAFDFGFMKEYGTVFRVYDDQDSGNICFGTERDGQRYFIKFAGAPAGRYSGEPADAIARLKATVPIYCGLRHKSLIEFVEAREIGGGFATVFKWADGDCMGRMYPDSHRRFMQLPVDARLAVFSDIISFFEHVVAQNYVAIDFYDGSILYDFENGRTTICDIDLFRK